MKGSVPLRLKERHQAVTVNQASEEDSRIVDNDVMARGLNTKAACAIIC
ncbi:MAG: hypothetical protein AAB502_08460 [Chloroflexota bacterium]